VSWIVLQDERMSVVVAYVITGICTHCSCYLRRL